MNIFYLDPDPVICARQHCDKHVVKMIIEYAQLMSTAHRVLDGHEFEGRTANGRRIKRFFHPDPYMQEHLYKVAHLNHPSTRWTRLSKENYEWLYRMWTELCKEYTYRYGKIHESQRKLEGVLYYAPLNIGNVPFTEPTPAMKAYPHCIVEGDSISSYRNFYWEDKREFAKWTKRDKPEWWKKYEWEGEQTATVLS
jgi:hypothetical protein